MRIRSSTGASTRAVRSDIARNPAKRAANPSETPSATGRAREAKASVKKSAVSAAGSQRTGSRSAERLSATPPMPRTGNQRKKRRSSTSRATARARAARQSGAKTIARDKRAAARTPAPPDVDMTQGKHSAKAGERGDERRVLPIRREERKGAPTAPTAASPASRGAPPHRSKGLAFETFILSDLARTQGSTDRRLRRQADAPTLSTVRASIAEQPEGRSGKDQAFERPGIAPRVEVFEIGRGTGRIAYV